MILEGNNELAPSGLLLGNTNGDELGEPDDVSDLLFLEFEVGVKDAEVELVFESH